MLSLIPLAQARAKRDAAMRILIVEDEETLLNQLKTQLKQEGYAVDGAADGESGLHLATEYPFDAAVVDLGLPKLSGIDVIRRTRRAGKTFPILILTARGRWQEKVAGLEAGADEYLVKPFHLEELLARLRALVRRAAGGAQPALHCGPVLLDTATHAVTVNGEAIELTTYEYMVLEYLMLHAGHVVSKTDLTEHIFVFVFVCVCFVFVFFLGRLRRKLDPNGV